MGKLVELSAQNIRRVCDPNRLEFETTADLPILSEVLGQPRAVAAFAFGTNINSPGFNLFALGQSGSGKTTLIRDYLERRAAAQPKAMDLCYVNNFADPRCPTALLLPPGLGTQLKKDMDALVEELETAIPKAFDSEEYSQHRDTVMEDLEAKRGAELARMNQQVAKAGFQLLKGPGGLLLVPASGGQPLSEEALEAIPPEEREKLARTREKLQHEIEERLRGVRELEKAARDALRALDTDTAAYATRHLMDDLRARYRALPAVLEYLEASHADVTAHLDDFRKGKDTDSPQTPVTVLVPGAEKAPPRYQVNVLVDNGALKGAPVVYESNPTYHNLTGRIEHQASWGGVVTDYTMIKPGALHRANGGYLIIPARECLLNPFAWEGLKRALKDRSARIEELGAQLGVVSTVTLDPQPVPLDIKVVLIGSPAIYYLLYAYDEDFQKLFKVKADFTTRMRRDGESEKAYALFVNHITRQDDSLPFDRTAVARIIEYGSRAAGGQDHLTTRFGEIADLIREATQQASTNSHQAITAADVRAAEEARRYRQNLVEERLQESLRDGTVLLETTGTAIGRINGLSVLDMGDYAFGHPVRLTATVGPGRRGVVSIEREVEMSGPIHGKGVLILGGYAMRKYGQAGPLSLSASLVFEQSYSMVEGDSASLAELCVLLSATAGAPLRQDIAVTGSVNQHGHVQPVGGVTEKIEGFFDLCLANGLTGTQGVFIPAANRRHLMLRDDVVEAVCNGRFHIWTGEQVDDALQLLTSMPVGEPDAAGVFPQATLHRAVADRLAQYAEMLRALSAAEDKKKETAV
jgi:lon-related putative ATP-dependent protease